MARIIETTIENLVPDNKNFNKGTQFGDHLMDKSLREFGLGRSILIDKNDRIIAGNKTFEKAGEIGFENRLEEHTSELQSRQYLVCRLLLEKKKNNTKHIYNE